MKIVMAASECVPFVKVGGLADVVGTLPKVLKAKGHDVRVILPKYQKIESSKFNLKTLPYRLRIPVGDAVEEITLKEGRLEEDIPVYFIENARCFHRPEVYRTVEGDYPDNRERFILFSRAVLESLKAIGFAPDIIHCHDWQTGIIPTYLKTSYYTDGFYWKTTTVYTIHNIAYQGMFGSDTVDVAGFPWKDFTMDKLEFYGHFNFMKAGLVFADALSTVSPTYAREIQYPEEGRGMEVILRNRANDLMGILNGIDYDEWDPENDPQIADDFSRLSLGGKAKCKADLQKTCRLPQRPNALVIGAVSRLDPQKGYDLVARVIPRIIDRDVQVVILGRGDRDIQEMLSGLAKRYPDKMSVNYDFNNPLAHKIYAGSDLFLMPSRFEPCGLGQMIAMSYGTIPVVNRTGGLADTVQDFDPVKGRGNGFTFSPATVQDFLSAMERAMSTYANKAAWNTVVQNALSADFSWENVVDDYVRLYEKALSKRKIY